MRMRMPMSDAWDILSHPSHHAAQIAIDREGVFVGGQPFDAMVAVTSILRAAKETIVVVDGYVSDQILSLLRVKAEPVSCKILTMKQSKEKTDLFLTHARAFVEQYGDSSLQLRVTEAFHDRFIVIDDSEYYHFGASIKDAAKKKAFMFSRIEEPAVLATLKKLIHTTWTSAEVVNIKAD